MGRLAKNFFINFGNLLSLSPRHYSSIDDIEIEFKECYTPKDDAESIASDFIAIGNDMRNVMGGLDYGKTNQANP